ncbi:stealth conserved region 3 domain-containing protein, partial [Rhodospirillales bacterium]|nr:stealth conserved region 3 domain-containing protein [Rhodospirillales bacterium]
MEVVYTWVDDRFPGYMEMLNLHIATKHDLNPNRTRNNLDILKYSLRSLQAYAPWVNKVTLISMSPQVPDWLNTEHSDIKILHHDDFIPERYLPTFSSFSIISHFHRLDSLPERFVYLEDDMVLGRPVPKDIFFDENGLINVWFTNSQSPCVKLKNNEEASPWNRALGLCNDLLDQRYAKENRKMIKHSPLVVDQTIWAKMYEEWEEYFEHTAQSKFRSTGDVAPEFLYRYYLVNEGYGTPV